MDSGVHMQKFTTEHTSNIQGRQLFIAFLHL